MKSSSKPKEYRLQINDFRRKLPTLSESRKGPRNALVTYPTDLRNQLQLK